MQTKSSWAALWMPLSLCYIAGILRQKGHSVKLVDCIAGKKDISWLTAATMDFRPPLVILNTAIPSVIGDLETASALKRALPGTRIAIIGMFPSLYEKASLERSGDIDFAIMDEPEWVASLLPEIINGNRIPESVKGLVFRKDGEIIMNERQNLPDNNPDDLPFPARDLLDNNAYRLPATGQKFTLLSVGRGCSKRCIYCVANQYYGRKFRKRNVVSIADEIEECISEYDIRNFLFWGESFTTDSVYGEEICDEIIKRNLEISWSTTSRVDTLNDQLLVKMKKAGCVLLGLGIESYDQAVLDNAAKGISLNQIDEAVAMTRKAGIRTMGHFVFGLPGDTRESAMRSIRFACRNLTFAQFYCAIPYPKTELEQIALRNGWIGKTDYTMYDLTTAVMRNDHLSHREVKKLRDYAYRRFYFRPVMILRTLREVKSLRALFTVFNFLDWIKPAK